MPRQRQQQQEAIKSSVVNVCLNAGRKSEQYADHTLVDISGCFEAPLFLLLRNTTHTQYAAGPLPGLIKQINQIARRTH